METVPTPPEPALRIAPGQERNTDAVDDGPVRKTVTVLFVDLVGSTAFQEGVDPEAARGAMTRYYDMVQRVIDAHHGTVAKFQGDGALAVFGVPEVAEDDAARAVAAGVELQHAFADIRDYVADRYGVEVGLRVGINTGEVVIADGDADLVGDVLNTAARLEAACTPGRVMVGEDTWRLTRSTVAYEVLGEISVKGKAAPIATFQVTEDAQQDAAEDEAATPFVGREAELATLHEAYTAAIGTASARLVTVIGAPGVGKTRLAAELAASLDEARAFDLRCERAGTSTFSPIADLVRSVASIGADQSGSEAEASVADWLGGATDADRLRPLLSSFVGGTDTFSTEELFFGARRLVELIAAERPAILVVDDIQWAEPLLLDLLEHLVEWVTEAPVLVVGLARPELREIRPSLAEPGRRVHSVVSLEGLDAQATAELAARLVGADRLPADLLARLPESTEGNPLFVRELMQMLVDDGVIARGPGGWALTIDAEAVDVPPTIQSLLSTRVERMPADERRLIELAAVVGPDFARGAVASITDGWSPSQIDDVIRRLQRKELIEPTGSYWGNEPIYRFHHVLIRDAAYRRLLKGSRAELHLLVGEWTEQTASALTGEHEVSIAHHFEQTYVYRRELGLDDETTAAAGSKAAELLTVAAGRALARDDLPAAGTLALRAIDCLADDAPELPSLLLMANEALLSSGDVTRATPALDLLETYRDEERLRQWAVCFRGQLTVLADPAGLDVAAAQLDSAADSLGQLDDHAGVAKARQIRALALAALGRVGDCEAELDRALTAARKADDRRRVTAVLGAAPVAALWGPSPVPRAGGRCLDVIRLLRITTGSPAVEATSIRCQAVLEALRGRFDTARTMLGTARQTAEEVGLRQDLNQTEYYAGLVELFAADPVAAEPHLRQAYEGLGRLGIGADAGQAAAHLARSLLLQGRIDEAEELADTSDALAGQNTQTAIAARSVRAEVLSARGRHDEAVPLAEEAVAIAAGTDILVDHAQALAALARVNAAAGNTGDATHAATAARSLFDQKGATVDVDAVEADLAESEQPSDRRWPEGNACTRLIDRILGVLAAGAVPAFDDLSPELVVEDHRTDVNFGTLDRASYQAQVESMADVGARPEGIDWLAARADSTALGSVTMAYGDGYSRRLLAVYRTDEESLCDRIGFFDPDDVPAAYRRMEDWFLETLDPAAREPWATIVDWVVAHNAGDVEAMEAWMRPDLQVVDHGTLGWGTQDRESAVARFAETAGSLEYALPTAILRYGAGASLSAHRYQYHDGASVEGYALTHNTTETTHRAEYFDLDQLDFALQRFDEVTAGADGIEGGHGQPSAEETAGRAAAELGAGSRIGRVLATQVVAFREGDWDGFAETFAERFDYRSARSGPGFGDMSTRAELIDNMRTRAELGYVEFRFRMVATRGEDLAVADLTFVTAEGLEESRLQLHVLDETGRLHRLRGFDQADLDLALLELDRMYMASFPEEHIRHHRSLLDVIAAGEASDRDHAEAILTSDRLGETTYVDHVGVGASDDESMLAGLRLGAQEAGTSFVRQVYRATPDVNLVELVRQHPDGAETVRLIVQEWPLDGSVNRLHIFGSDQLGEAFGLFDELDRGVAGGAVSAVTNTASARFAHIAEAYRRQDWRSLDDLVGERFALTDRRTDPSDPPPLEGWLGFVAALERSRIAGFTELRHEAVAVRGDRLALVASVLSSEDGSTEQRLGIHQVDAGGRLVALTLFDPADVMDAVAELDRIWLDEVGREANAAYAQVSDNFQRAISGGWTWESFFSKDLAYADHRTPNLDNLVTAGTSPTADSETHPARFAVSWTGVDAAFASEVLASAANTVLLRHASDRGAWEYRDSLVLAVVHDGKVRRYEHWDGSDRLAALARFHELEHQDEPFTVRNGATDHLEESAHAYRRGDWGRLEDLVDERVVFTDRRVGPAMGSVVRGVAPFLAGVKRSREAGVDQLRTETVAVRGERLAVARWVTESSDGLVDDRLNLHEVNAAGRLVSISAFDATDHEGALAELDRAFSATLDEGRSAVYEVVLEHFATDDAEALRSLLAEGVAVIDHKSLGWGELDRESYIDRIVSLGNGTLSVLAMVHRLTDDGCVFTGAVHHGADVSKYVHWVCLTSNGQHDRIESFDEDDLVLALRRFDDLRGGAPHVVEDQASADDGLDRGAAREVTEQPELINTAARQMGELARRFRIGEIDSTGELLSDTFVRHDRRSGIAADPLHGREAMIESFRALHELGLLAEFDPEVVALRGDALALFDTRMVAENGAELHVFQLVALGDDDRAISLDLFDVDDADGALQHLELLYRDPPVAAGWSAPPADVAAVLETMAVVTSALNRNRPDELSELLTDDFESVNHLGLRWPKAKKAAFIEQIESAPRSAQRVWVARPLIDRVVGSLILNRFDTWTVGPETHAATWRIAEVSDGRCSRSEVFELDDYAGAVARFEELASAAAVSGLSNRCDLAVRDLVGRAEDHDWAGVEALISPDIEVITHRTGPTVSTDDAGGFVQNGLRGYVELGFRLRSREVLAVRRDDLVLAQMRWTTPDGDEVEWLAVEGVDGEGRLVLVVQFDPEDLRAAVAELEQRHAGGLESARAAMALGGAWFTATVVDADVEALDAVLAEDFTSVDHRPLGLGSRSRADFLASVGARPATLGEGLGFVPEMHALDEHCGLFTYEARTSATDSGSPVVERALAAVRRRDGRWVDVDLYDVTQMDEAQQRYDELRSQVATEPAGHDLAPAPPTGDTNRAVERLMALLHASANADADGVMLTLSPDLERHDRRLGVSAPDMTNAEFAASTVELMRLRSESPRTEVVATRGDRLALAEGGVTTQEGFEVRFLILLLVDSEDRIERIENFDRDDLAAALARLDDLYASTLSAEDRQPFDRIARGIHARNAVATGRIAMVPPGASFTGDGALEFPELEPDSDAAKMLSAAELGGITVMQPVHVARAGAALMTMRTALEDGEVVRHFVFRRRNDGQLVVHYFEENALAEAMVAVDTPPDDAVSEPPQRPTNLATITSDRVSELVRNGVVDDLVDWWHPEATARDYSRLGGGAGGRDDFIEAMRSWREVWDIGQPDSGGPISIKGDHAALVEYRFGTVGSWSVDRLAVLAVNDDGRITELTFYDHDDREIAQAALDGLKLAAEVNADVESSPAEPGPGTGQPTNPADRLARQHGVLVDGEVVAVIDTLGVRLDDFALHRVSGPGEGTALALSCWTSGELVTAQRFEEGDIQKAYFELDEWAGETLAPHLWRSSAIRAWAKATQDHDWATARALLHPDYSARSHQLLGPDEMSGETLVRWFESLEARAVTFVVATPELHAMSEVGGVVWEEFEQLDTDGFAVSNGGVSVVILRDGKLAQSARFDDDQLLDALEMLEEIAEAAGAADTIAYFSESARALRPGR